VEAFEEAGFYGIRSLKRDAQPWRVVEGMEFRSLTIEAFKTTESLSLERHQAVIYKGPFKAVLDDHDHHITRGIRYAVSDKTYRLFKKAPYAEHFEFIEPHIEVPIAEAEPFDSTRETPRHPKETKGHDYEPFENSCCDGGNCCG
ncbi:MAG: methyltransferase, partial [Verrucomicrobiota bacterium]